MTQTESKKILLAAWLFLLLSASAFAAAHYVDVNSASPVPPYNTWATAATTIQDAVDASTTGEEIVVTNGTYATGGRPISGSTQTNRVLIGKPLTLRSVNGPQFTMIRGYQVPGTTNGAGAIRCVYLTNGASLYGFTLTNGATQYPEGGGGIFCMANSVVSNCVMTATEGSYKGGRELH